MSPIRDLIDDLRQEDFDDAADMIERLMAENAELRAQLERKCEVQKETLESIRYVSEALKRKGGE